MNLLSILPRVSCVSALLVLSAPALTLAQNPNPPVVVNPVADVRVAVNSAPTVIDLKKTFGLNGVTGKLVRMTTNVGNIDLQLFSDVAPNTVTNFLNYVGAGSYNSAIFHRSTSLATDGLAIIQGGEAILQGNAYSLITTFGNVNNEYGLPNTRGTIAMAKVGGQPDSASDQWFINVSDNSDVLGPDNNGGFTVFGRVIEQGLATVDAISALPTQDLSSVRYDWTNIPLYNYDPAQGARPENLVVASSVAILPVTSKGVGYPGAILLKVKGNTNAGLVTATLKARKLVLTFVEGQTGTAAITIQAKGAAKAKITHTFNVTVE